MAAVSASLALVLTACGEDPEPAQIEDAAADYAEALAQISFDQVAFDAGSATQMEEAAERIHTELEPAEVAIEVSEIDLDMPEEDSPRSPRATVEYTHTWDLEELGIDGEEFSYATSADFRYDEETDTWYVEAATEHILPDYQGHETFGIVTTPAERGRIMDDSGTAMVYNRDVIRIGIDKTLLPDLDEDTQAQAAEELADAVGVDPEVYAESVLGHGDEAFVEAITVRREGGHVTADDIADIPGATTIEDQMPLAESRDFAPLLLGRVGPVTAEHLEEDPTLSVGDTVGTSGIQATHDATLRGSPGMRIHLAGETLYSVDPEAGEDIYTSLNPRLQRLGQEIVGDQDVTAALVAIRPSDGGILAAASHTEESSYVDIATQSTFAPGSTFKVVSALAMLRDGLAPGSEVECPNQTTVHGQNFGNVEGYPSEYLGEITFSEAVAVSCNTLFADAWDDVSSEEVQQAAFDLGIDNEISIGLPATFGSVPGDAELNLHAANLFGQGVVETSPLGMATVAASAAAGETVRPYLVARDEDAELPTGGLTSQEAEDLLELMEGTVDYGTLSSMDVVPGEHVYAKTGTAEAGGEDDPHSHTWAIAVHGDLAVAIFLEEGEFGGSTNGPLLHEFLTGAHQILNE